MTNSSTRVSPFTAVRQPYSSTSNESQPQLPPRKRSMTYPSHSDREASQTGHGSSSFTDLEHAVSDMDGEVDGDITREEDEGESLGSRTQSTESKEGGERKKKPRITLARGGACVVCRWVWGLDEGHLPFCEWADDAFWPG